MNYNGKLFKHDRKMLKKILSSHLFYQEMEKHLKKQKYYKEGWDDQHLCLEQMWLLGCQFAQNADMIYRDVGVIASFLRNDSSYDMNTCFYLSNVYFHLSSCINYGLPLIPENEATRECIEEEYIRLASSKDSAFHHSEAYFHSDDFDLWHQYYVDIIIALYRKLHYNT